MPVIHGGLIGARIYTCKSIVYVFFLFLSTNTFLLTASSFTYGKRTTCHVSTAILQDDILQNPNSRSGEIWEMGVWRPEISSPKPRCRETYWRASPPFLLPFTRVCPFSSRSVTCIIGSPYPENIHLRTLETNALYSIPWDNSYFPPRLSLMITFWHCIINVCPRKKIPFKVNPRHETFGPCSVAWIRVSYCISYGENIRRERVILSLVVNAVLTQLTDIAAL